MHSLFFVSAHPVSQKEQISCGVLYIALIFEFFLSDGLRNVPGEDCDDGNDIATDGCHNCKVSVCL